MASKVFSTFFQAVFEGDYDLENGTYKVALLGNAEPAIGDEDWSDVSGDEISGTGYTTGGASLTTPAVTRSNAVVTWDADNVVWTTATFTAYHAVVYETVTSKLIMHFDFGGAVSSAGDNFVIQWSDNGLLVLDFTA